MTNSPSPSDQGSPPKPTEFLINPGGRLREAGESTGTAAPPASPQHVPQRRAQRVLELPPISVPNGLNDLAPFLVLATRLRLGQAGVDGAELLAGVGRDLRRVFELLPQRGWDVREANLAKFFVCCAVDNAALNSQFASTWTGNQLTSSFFRTAAGGVQFFTNVEAMLKASPQARPPLRLFELAYQCLICGFEGKYSAPNAPRDNIEDLKTRLRAVIGEGGRISTANFLGTGLPQPQPLAQRQWRLPVWSIAAVVAAACFALLFAYRFLLGTEAEAAIAKLEEGSAQPLPALTTPATPVPQQAAWIDRLRIVAGKYGFAVTQNGAKVDVTASGGLFASGSDQLRADLIPAYADIGRLLNEARGSVIVRGHTDQQPIASLQFANNKELSRARAKAVGQVVLGTLEDKTRVYTEALGDTQPLCRDAASDCMARNRRVEVVLDPGR